ncbi:13073_t:CDS:1 [Ambispora leptoticha]|uniref:13073_t:CDS:1 n=1 Tax=Ambispora leptoticha TaxID=144679 RepID=A0A9N9ELC5_9GLOM|nr:13073_t:CDS:1 [Ambispora leptoticha]
MKNLSEFPTEILQCITELIPLRYYGSLMSTSRIFLQQIDIEDFWLYLTSKRYSSIEVSPLVSAPALDLYHIDLHNRRRQRNITLPINPPLWKYIFRVYFQYTGPVLNIHAILKVPRVIAPNKKHDQYEEMYDFMTRLVDKMIAKWPWLYPTYSEKDAGLREPYYSDEGKVEISGPIGRFITGTLYGQGGLYRTCTILDISFDPKSLYTISMNLYTLVDERGMNLHYSTGYTFPSLSLTNLSSRSSHFDEFLQKCETILTMFLFHHFYKFMRPTMLHSEIKWYRFANEQESFGKLLEEKINKYAKMLIEQLQLYIKPLDYTSQERVITFLDNPKTKKSKTIHVAVIRSIRRRLRIFLGPLQCIFNFYQDDNILQEIINICNKYEGELPDTYPNMYPYDFDIIKNIGYWSLFRQWEHYRFNWQSSYRKARPIGPCGINFNKLSEGGCRWWSVGLQGIALEVLEPLSKYIGLDILQNIIEGNEIILMEKIREQKELKFRQIEMIVDKYHFVKSR